MPKEIKPRVAVSKNGGLYRVPPKLLCLDDLPVIKNNRQKHERSFATITVPFEEEV